MRLTILFLVFLPACTSVLPPRNNPNDLFGEKKMNCPNTVAPTIDQIQKILTDLPGDYQLYISRHDFVQIVDANPGLRSLCEATGVREVVFQPGPWRLVKLIEN